MLTVYLHLDLVFFTAGSHISQKLKLTYKTSTSKLVSSFKGAPSGSQLVCMFSGHRDGVWEVNASKVDGRIIGTASAGNHQGAAPDKAD